MTRVRVRGIYATALAKLLLKNGFELSDLSQKLKERLKHDGSPEPPDVTVKQADYDPNEVVVIGFPEKTDEVINVLKTNLPFSIHFIAKPNLHSAYKIKMDENCFTEIEGIKVRVKSKECYEGRETVAEVVRSRVKPRDEVLMEEGFRVIGYYAELIVGRGPGVTFSKHITNPTTKGMLASLAADITARGFRVHWRSAARSAPADKLREELERLVDEAIKISLRAREAPPGAMLYPGERLDVVMLAFEDKSILDELRREVLPTMKYHHTLKSGGEKMSAAVELGDKLSECCVVKEETIIEYLMEVLRDSKFVEIRHDKVTGENITLGRAKYVTALDKHAVLKRVVKEYGKYDGIEAIKEPNDVILTLVKPFKNSLVHAYFNEFGELKGIYVNINTGVEVGEGFIRYVDLEVDVVKTKSGELKVIDVEGLKTLPDELRKLAERTVSEVKEKFNEIEEMVNEARAAVFEG